MDSDCHIQSFELLHYFSKLAYDCVTWAWPIWKFKIVNSYAVTLKFFNVIQWLVKSDYGFNPDLFKNWNQLLRGLAWVLSAVGLCWGCAREDASWYHPRAVQVAQLFKSVNIYPIVGDPNLQTSQNIHGCNWEVSPANAGVPKGLKRVQETFAEGILNLLYTHIAV